ncbi:MAG: hypothetical protein APR55_03730 [Methanolinea sp. SDB]|nr:MAG: hypothetical protein APR55_03730 [Methanolinea sp. SDB]
MEEISINTSGDNTNDAANKSAMAPADVFFPVVFPFMNGLPSSINAYALVIGKAIHWKVPRELAD